MTSFGLEVNWQFSFKYIIKCNILNVLSDKNQRKFIVNVYVKQLRGVLWAIFTYLKKCYGKCLFSYYTSQQLRRQKMSGLEWNIFANRLSLNFHFWVFCNLIIVLISIITLENCMWSTLTRQVIVHCLLYSAMLAIFVA